MAFNFHFCSIEESGDIGKLVDFLQTQDLGYPHYDHWVQRTEAELQSGYKQAVLGFSNGHLIGDIVFQPHKQLPRVREIKNIRVHPAVRGRYVAAFMLRQAEVEAKQEYDALLVDARTDQQDIIRLLRGMGFVPIAETPLYDPSVPDIILIKAMDARTKTGIIYNAKNLVLGRSYNKRH